MSRYEIVSLVESSKGACFFHVANITTEKLWAARNIHRDTHLGVAPVLRVALAIVDPATS
jgi:hypothetical protein